MLITISSLRKGAGRWAEELEMAFLSPTTAFQSPDSDVSLASYFARYKIQGWATRLVQYTGPREAREGWMCSRGAESPSHNSQGVLHTNHRQTAVLTPAWRAFKTLGHSRRVTGSQVYPKKPKLSPATNIIMETLLFCWWKLAAVNMDPTVAPIG